MAVKEMQLGLTTSFSLVRCEERALIGRFLERWWEKTAKSALPNNTPSMKKLVATSAKPPTPIPSQIRLVAQKPPSQRPLRQPQTPITSSCFGVSAAEHSRSFA
ncbi:hypothetical protein ACS0TY_032541 [Phlomoides rotata]